MGERWHTALQRLVGSKPVASAVQEDVPVLPSQTVPREGILPVNEIHFRKDREAKCDCLPASLKGKGQGGAWGLVERQDTGEQEVSLPHYQDGFQESTAPVENEFFDYIPCGRYILNYRRESPAVLLP